MILERYITLDKSLMGEFEEFNFQESGDFYWFYGSGKIGLSGRNTLCSMSFVRGFLTDYDRLIIDQRNFRIMREKRGGEISARPTRAGVGGAVKLLGLFNSNEVLHSFISMTTAYVAVLTFSIDEPNSVMYKKVNPMEVIFES